MPTASLLAIGNELLNGVVRDANLFSLSQHLTQMGFCVTHAAMVRDDPVKIAHVVLFLLAQKPDVLLCSGGLGPTEDDLTLSALTEALHVPLVLNSAAAGLVESHYDRLLAQHYLALRPAFARQNNAFLGADLAQPGGDRAWRQARTSRDGDLRPTWGSAGTGSDLRRLGRSGTAAPLQSGDVGRAHAARPLR